MNTIFTRRSIRHYKNQSVDPAQVEQLLHAAMAAPSAGNDQAWCFILIDRRDLLDAIPEFHPYGWMCTEAAIAILVCGDLALDKHDGMWVQGCSAATENILLEAADMGLGTVWVGVHPREDRVAGFRKLLAIDDPNIVPFSLIPIGHPDEIRPDRDNFDANRIHHNKW